MTASSTGTRLKRFCCNGIFTTSHWWTIILMMVRWSWWSWLSEVTVTHNMNTFWSRDFTIITTSDFCVAFSQLLFCCFDLCFFPWPLLTLETTADDDELDLADALDPNNDISGKDKNKGQGGGCLLRLASNRRTHLKMTRICCTVGQGVFGTDLSHFIHISGLTKKTKQNLLTSFQVGFIFQLFLYIVLHVLLNVYSFTYNNRLSTSSENTFSINPSSLFIWSEKTHRLLVPLLQQCSTYQFSVLVCI